MQGGSQIDHGLHSELDQKAADSQHDKQVNFLPQAPETTQNDKGKQGDNDQTPDKAKFFTRDGENEIGMRVGDGHFHSAFARARTQQPAIHKGVERAIHLIGVAAMAQEPVHARGKVGQSVISAKQADNAQPAANAHGHDRKSGQKELPEPDGGH